MSLTSFAVPTQAAIPFARPLVGAIAAAFVAFRPLVALCLMAAALWIFKPFLRGLARASLMMFNRRESLAQRQEKRTLRSIIALNSMARELDTLQPSLAAELRLLAARG